jgi:hypothetical protein
MPIAGLSASALYAAAMQHALQALLLHARYYAERLRWHAAHASR